MNRGKRNKGFNTSFHICKACFENTLEDEYEDRFPNGMPDCVVVGEGESCPQCGGKELIYNRDVVWEPILHRVIERGPDRGGVRGGLHRKHKSVLKARAWQLVIQEFDYRKIDQMPLLSLGRSWWGQGEAFVSGWYGWARGDRQFMEYSPLTGKWMHYPASLQSYDYASMRTWETAIDNAYTATGKALEAEQGHHQRLTERFERRKKANERRDKVERERWLTEIVAELVWRTESDQVLVEFTREKCRVISEKIEDKTELNEYDDEYDDDYSEGGVANPVVGPWVYHLELVSELSRKYPWVTQFSSRFSWKLDPCEMKNKGFKHDIDELLETLHEKVDLLTITNQKLGALRARALANAYYGYLDDQANGGGG